MKKAPIMTNGTKYSQLKARPSASSDWNKINILNTHSIKKTWIQTR